jgi:hypothetical protein
MRKLMAFVILLCGAAGANACETVVTPKPDYIPVATVPLVEQWDIVSDEGEPNAAGEITVFIQYKGRFYHSHATVFT